MRRAENVSPYNSRELGLDLKRSQVNEHMAEGPESKSQDSERLDGRASMPASNAPTLFTGCSQASALDDYSF